MNNQDSDAQNIEPGMQVETIRRGFLHGCGYGKTDDGQTSDIGKNAWIAQVFLGNCTQYGSATMVAVNVPRNSTRVATNAFSKYTTPFI